MANGDIKNARFTHVSHGALSCELAVVETSQEPILDEKDQPVLDGDGKETFKDIVTETWEPRSINILDDDFEAFVAENDIEPLLIFEEIADAQYLNEEKTNISFTRRLAGEKTLSPSSVMKIPENGELKTALANALFDRVVLEAGDVKDYEPPVYDADAAKVEAKAATVNFIDQMRERLTANFSKAEQDGWINTLAEARALIADNKAAAPGVRLQASIEGIDALDLAKGIVAASKITAIIPNLAAGFRAKTNALIDATDGSQEQITAVLEQLGKLGETVVAAAAKRDEKALQKALGAL